MCVGWKYCYIHQPAGVVQRACCYVACAHVVFVGFFLTASMSAMRKLLVATKRVMAVVGKALQGS